MKLPAELNTLLKEVSRSFYLSLRFLPSEVRGYLSLAYLLARATDTIADCESAGTPLTRHDLLTRWPTQGNADFFKEISAIKVDHPGEQRLLQRLPEVFAARDETETTGRELILKVLGHILQGQRQDLLKFPGAFTTAAELEEYTFLVAGCVGQFWSEILAWKIPGWSNAPDSEMIALGKRYGQGLQLVNILRDAAQDAVNGRTYLPGPGTQAERRAHWIPIAREWLAAGTTYVSHLNGWRLRFTADLPWQLGLATLEKIATSSGRAKISRSEVRKIFMRSLWHQTFRRS